MIEIQLHELVILCLFLLISVALGYIGYINIKSRKAEKQKDEAERMYHEQKDFLEQLVDNLPAIVFVKKANEGFQYHMFNKEAVDFFGFSSEEMVGKSDFDFYVEEQAQFFRTMDESTMAGRRIIDIPCEMITTPRGEHFLHTRKVPIYDRDGKPLYLLGLSEDITARKKTELELRDYRENLERMVEERTEKLKIAMARAEEANRLKSEFLATMSHEIRSPMSGVLGMAELLLDTDMTSEQKNLTKTILASGEVLMNIIEDILDFSKIEANKLELDPIPVNMLDIVDDVCALYASKARDKALEIAVHYIPGSEQFVYADPTRMRQVIGNLINNAIKFTEVGHIGITVKEDKDAGMASDMTRLVFTIQDTGIGIPNEYRERIFEKFSQANSSNSRDHGGTGLGLSICRRLIQLMNGDIILKETSPKGSIFEFHVDLKRNTEETHQPVKPPVLKGVRILVVDDLPIVRTILQEQLSLAGMSCDTAQSGQEALAMMMKARNSGESYDMVIIDYLMPEMNGEMLARAISDEPEFRKTCLVMLTAAGNPVLEKNLERKGFSAYISKPIRCAQLLDMLAIIWKRYSDGDTESLIRVDSVITSPSLESEDHLKLKGSRILLVEDSRLNQAFAEEVLSQLDCIITTASNGQEAIDILRNETFDLVLMDCQMPIMDGFEASRRIVQLKRQGVIDENMPVIALTANAMKGDRQRCIDAGMHDYISKPVRKKDLKEKIFHWIKHKGNPSMLTTSDPEPDERHSSAILDEDIFDEAREILKEKFDFMLTCFIEDIEVYLKDIQHAVANKDIEAVVRPSHTIKSSSRRLGAMWLSEKAASIEIAAREAVNSNDSHIWERESFVEDLRSLPKIFKDTCKKLKDEAA